jgi:hypothetical protein
MLIDFYRLLLAVCRAIKRAVTDKNQPKHCPKLIHSTPD